jgi:hypothetical protein
MNVIVSVYRFLMGPKGAYGLRIYLARESVIDFHQLEHKVKLKDGTTPGCRLITFLSSCGNTVSQGVILSALSTTFWTIVRCVYRTLHYVCLP